MALLILYNEPTLPADDQDRVSEAGVLESVEAVVEVLRSGGEDVQRLGLGSSLEPLLEALARRPVVFNLCEGFAGRSAGESGIAGLIELLGVPATGCPAEAMSLCRHKPRTKYVLRGAGLPTAAFRVIDRLPVDRGGLDWPLIVKPGCEDASLGLDQGCVVTSDAALAERVERVLDRYGPPVLVERFIDGREFNIGLYQTAEELHVLPVGEVLFPRDGSAWPILTYAAKWAPESPECLETPVRCPADIEPPLVQALARLAHRAFEVTGCRDYARVDVRVTPGGDPFILEVNPNPDLAPTAGYARSLAAAGIPYPTMVRQFLANARARAG